MRRSLFALALIGTAFASGSARAQIHVACVGDSITAGLACFVAALASVGVRGVVFDSGRRLLAAVLLLLPGLASDLFALLLLMVPNRTPQTAAATVAPAPGPKTMDGEFRRVE